MLFAHYYRNDPDSPGFEYTVLLFNYGVFSVIYRGNQRRHFLDSGQLG